MSISKPNKAAPKARIKASRATPVQAATYHGVRLQKPVGPSRFSTEEIRNAVKAAIAENPGVFGGKT